ncbi:fimbrial protein [Erwinia sp. Eh17-17]|uniref:fimbrial protein n=1 Tax=Erwinia sp. Eh17-17 TaxID=3080330 RepID=UPI00320A5438
MKTILSVILLLLTIRTSCAMVHPAQGCGWYYKGFLGYAYVLRDVDASYDGGLVNISPSSTAGSIIVPEFRFRAENLGSLLGMTCAANTTLTTRYSSAGNFVSGINPVGYPKAAGKEFSTNIPGIGMIISLKDTTLMDNSAFFPLSNTLAVDAISAGGVTFAVMLVKTGPVPQGQNTFTGQSILTDSHNNNYVASFRQLVQLDQCAVANKESAIGVPMGTVSRQNLKSAAATGGEMKNFAIPLVDCHTRSGSNNVAKVRFDATGGSTIVDIDNGILGLDSRSEAKGVGIQILKENGITPFPLGKETSAGTIKPGNMTLNFRARYVKTNDHPQPGSANARASFTVSYN